MKRDYLAPTDPRFSWSYDHSVCRDADTDKVWVLMIDTHPNLKTGYYFERAAWPVATPICTRKQSAIRSLMRLITAGDKENDNASI